MIIIDNDISPEREIYYLGAMIIEILKSIPKNEVELFDAFQLLNERTRISMNLFVLTLDWLYLLGVINNREGQIVKCF